MQLPTAKDRFLQFFRPAKTSDPVPAPAEPAKSWPAPGRKSRGLVLMRSPVGGAIRLVPGERLLGAASAAPFPAPMQEDAFAMPRPVPVTAWSSPWAIAAQKSTAPRLRAAEPVRAEVEFSRPPFLEKKSARHPGGLCRSC